MIFYHIERRQPIFAYLLGMASLSIDAIVNKEDAKEKAKIIYKFLLKIQKELDEKRNREENKKYEDWKTMFLNEFAINQAILEHIHAGV